MQYKREKTNFISCRLFSKNSDTSVSIRKVLKCFLSNVSVSVPIYRGSEKRTTQNKYKIPSFRFIICKYEEACSLNMFSLQRVDTGLQNKRARVV